MPAIARVGIDTVGGALITGPGEPSVKVNGATVSVLGDAVAPHGPPPHDAATIIQASGTVKAGGIGVVRVGDLASCGDVVATGSPDTNAGG